MRRGSQVFLSRQFGSRFLRDDMASQSRTSDQIGICFARGEHPSHTTALTLPLCSLRLNASRGGCNDLYHGKCLLLHRLPRVRLRCTGGSRADLCAVCRLRSRCGRLTPNLRFTLTLSSCIGAVAIVVLVLGAPLIMGVFGSEYSANAATVLQILAFGTVFLVVKDHYVAIARIRGNVRSAARLCVAGAALELGLATCGGAYGGLTWLAFGQVVALGIEAVVMGPTVIRAAEWQKRNLVRWLMPTRDEPR